HRRTRTAMAHTPHWLPFPHLAGGGDGGDLGLVVGFPARQAGGRTEATDPRGDRTGCRPTAGRGVVRPARHSTLVYRGYGGRPVRFPNSVRACRTAACRSERHSTRGNRGA